MKRTQKQHLAPQIGLWLLALALFLGTWFHTDQRQRDHLGRAERGLRSTLEAEVAEVRAELESIRGDLEEQASDTARELAERVNTAELLLSEVGSVVEAQGDHLSQLEEAQTSFGPDILREELDSHARTVEVRWAKLSGLVNDIQQIASVSSQKVAELSEQRDLEKMWGELVGPVVQLAGDASVGSGVLLHSLKDEASDGYVTHLLTAWHVVRDIQGDLSKQHVPVPVAIYALDGTTRDEKAKLLCFEPDLDAALLELRTPKALDFGADLASRERLRNIRIFDQIYAVGCPLGNDPIPTRGEIATNRHDVDGELYWMINAPTYIGNSGGGIFDSSSHELLGIFSKIYTHGSLRPTIVPHMGLVTPLDAIYEWLEAEGYGHIAPSSSEAAEAGQTVRVEESEPSGV